MNLGFNKTLSYWRQNTETIYISSDLQLIDTAKRKYLAQLDNCISMKIKLASKLESEVSNICNKIFNFKTRIQYKQLFAKFILESEIKNKKDFLKLAKLTKKLVNLFELRYATKDTFIMSLILFYLSERKHTREELNQKLLNYEVNDNLAEIIVSMIGAELIEEDQDFVKVNLDALF